MNSSYACAEKMKKKTVCVTGASGFIAAWIVKLLLERGYIVKASVRNPDDAEKNKHLIELPGAESGLLLCKANLLEEGSFDSIVDGCDGVFHVASPCFFETNDPQADLIEPAVKGTLNVLRSCAKTPSVKRVVLTASICSIFFNKRLKTPEVVVDESWFSDPEYCKEKKLWYHLSKTLAEEEAWKFVKDHGIDMVTMHPGVVTGPRLQPTMNLSIQLVLDLVNGAKTYKNETYGWVDIRDVANAHILAFEVPSATGRYLLVERVAHYSGIVKMLRELYPNIQLPEKCVDDKFLEPTFQSSKEKAESLGVKYMPLEISMKETIESLKAEKFISI